MKAAAWLVGLFCIIATVPALAYIGPGAGISFIGSLFSTLMVVVLAVGAILLWPLRYAWRRVRRLAREANADHNLPQTADNASGKPDESPEKIAPAPQ